jgi:hypothetical protein
VTILFFQGGFTQRPLNALILPYVAPSCHMQILTIHSTNRLWGLLITCFFLHLCQWEDKQPQLSETYNTDMGTNVQFTIVLSSVPSLPDELRDDLVARACGNGD